MNDNINIPGTDTVRPVKYSLAELRNYIKDTCLEEKCSFVNDATDSVTIGKKFLLLLEGALTLDELTTLFVASSMMYFKGANAENLECRWTVLERCFVVTDTKDPMHFHLFARRLWNGMQKDGARFVINILEVVAIIGTRGVTGRGVALCLLWAIICEITETENPMYRFREFSELIDMLKNIDERELNSEDRTQHVYILVKTIGYLLSIVFDNNHNKELRSAGYGELLEYKLPDLVILRQWAITVCDALKINTFEINTNWDVHLMSLQIINQNILTPLIEKISHMTQEEVT